MLNLTVSKVTLSVLTITSLVVLTPLASSFAASIPEGFTPVNVAKNMPNTLACPYSMATDNLVETAANEGVFSTLITALNAAGLTKTLMDANTKFTVFAPTDEAFSKLPPGTLEMLLLPENKAKLTKILSYHVVIEPLNASEIQKNNLIRTLQGSTLKVATFGGKPYVNNAEITRSNVYATNGIIHVIDTVLMP
jgi:uncharacterized surface protein with fasciclin (FAS1) repeats